MVLTAKNIHPGTFTCNSRCEIEIHGEKYAVLWKLVPVKSTSTSGEKSHTACDTISDDDLEEDDLMQPPDGTKHCLPFEVLGTCHHVVCQKALEEAHTYMEEHNRPIFAKKLRQSRQSSRQACNCSLHYVVIRL